jgi:transglutaminase-like putative cysteine protease
VTRFAVRHETRYGYGAKVAMGLHLLRLTPRAIAGQRALGQRLTIVPEPARLRTFLDHFGNVVHHVAIETAHDFLSVTLDANVEVARAVAPDDGPPWEDVRDSLRAEGFPAWPMVAEFTYPSPLAAPEANATLYAAESFTAGRPIGAALRDLTARIHRDFPYTPYLTTVTTTIAEIMAMRSGVCQDFAHVMIAGLRGLGLPARYVSGYVHTYPADGGSARLGADASHAWVSVWCGNALGWLELDPTNDLVVASEHVVVAYGRDFSDVTPFRGIIMGGGYHTLDVAVTVTALDGVL